MARTSETLKLTDAIIARLPMKTYADSTQAGFGLVVGKKARTFFVRVDAFSDAVELELVVLH